MCIRDRGHTDLDQQTIKSEFESATIERNVGYDAETIIKFYRLLNSLNAKLLPDQKYTGPMITVKILVNITHPESLALEAIQELNAASGNRKFERVVPPVAPPARPMLVAPPPTLMGTPHGSSGATSPSRADR